MEFTWDNDKAARNQKQHGIRFEESMTVFGDAAALTKADMGHSDDEDREVTIGMSSRNRLLIVVHVWREPVMRIISARKATKHERSDYEQAFRKT